ncbi:tRNA (adenosine(37)-N6)-threonylcarbamoyltransferase complex dimerization subunit type 1 TsaB [Corynebacterium breve]|uniref:tRNA (Adenosine(37)-N6)-threonylcarbamoyltransferase complex dimerization subunit type 1 TsaB n=1 Tax=Corynebacterium breve TaxID=3049799 RepID=A0ABY8VH39_9CORY|nr:tRNA (adenosine(37)-N6)-threonylcarbamoyltransferase complex dimerization subunit type 1 TsaB [Corynebacterium breve]WIM68986.1 tRNA (adenosine(37)-N6)-threonylcarbamoyltransferase complex dimerization subunit type 1 TsaB [Corynebacterium breve]
MWVLALDTATADLVTGLVNATTGEVFDEVIHDTRSHNELLVPTIQLLLKRAELTFDDLSAIAVGCGPGPFTGLRVGMATASALGQALGLPVHGVVTHDAVAALIDEPSSLIVTDARRREVYWARYTNGSRVSGPDVIAPAQLAVDPVDVMSVPDHIRDSVSVDAGTVTYRAPSALGLVSAADLESEPGPLVPHYLRRPDAKEPAPKPKSPAIPEVEL